MSQIGYERDKAERRAAARFAARYPGRCVNCHESIEVGQSLRWDGVADEAPTPGQVVEPRQPRPPDQTPEGGASSSPPHPSVAMEPGSPEWTRRITASKVAAILGVSPWQSPRALWHEMRGDVERPETNDAMRRGTYLEPGILAWWRDQHPDFEVRDEQHVFDLGEWAAATPDMNGELDGEPVLVEAKTASSDEDWGSPGTDAIPAYYLVQVQWQMHVSDIHTCYVPLLTSRLRLVEYVVPYYAEYGPELEARCRAFYDSLKADDPPPLDASAATFNVIRKLHKDIERGESVELTYEDALGLVVAHADLKHLEADSRLTKARVIDQMQRAQYATHNGVRIARRQPRGEDVTFVVVAKPANLTAIDCTEEAS